VTCNRSTFSSGTPLSSTNKTNRHDITEILLNRVNHQNPNPKPKSFELVVSEEMTFNVLDNKRQELCMTMCYGGVRKNSKFCIEPHIHVLYQLTYLTYMYYTNLHISHTCIIPNYIPHIHVLYKLTYLIYMYYTNLHTSHICIIPTYKSFGLLVSDKNISKCYC